MLQIDCKLCIFAIQGRKKHFGFVEEGRQYYNGNEIKFCLIEDFKNTVPVDYKNALLTKTKGCALQSIRKQIFTTEICNFCNVTK